MSICTESTRGPREPVLQVLVAARVFLGHRVNLQEKYDYPYSHSETDFKNMRAEALEEFVADVARGTNLRFTPKGGHP